MDRYAKTKTLGIDDQLKAGVRVFDLRVTNSRPTIAGSYSGDGGGGLWICHGQNKIEVVDAPLELSVAIPEGLRADNRMYYLLRAHEGVADIIATADGTPLVGYTDRFSTYVLSDKDAPGRGCTS